ncbi:MAG: hypothetical protein AAF597_15530 [Bacteroidota bacterium]
MSKNEVAHQAQEILRIANEAAAEARAENARLGLANSIFISGVLYFELPDGSLTQNDPSQNVDA